MKNKLICIALALCFSLSCAFMLTACTPTNDPLTNAELSALYKEIAISSWNEIGVSDPTVSTQTLSAIPDKKIETSDPNDIFNIKINANSMSGLIYMVGLLYDNENFSVKNDIAVFNATIEMQGQSFSQNYVLKTSLNKSKNKLVLEVVTTVDGVAQYSNLELNYNFNSHTLISYRLCGCVMDNFYDMSLTSDNKNMWYWTSDTEDSFATALTQAKAQLLSNAESVAPLTATFDSEIQAYLNAVQDAMQELM